MLFATPAADAYHATAAVTTPHQPPACSHQVWPLCESTKKPITSTISVISSVRNTRNTAADTRRLLRSMYVLKTANANRYHASALVRSPPWNPAVNFVVPARITKIPRPIQNPPYVENAVAPNTLRLRNSHIPARNCARPP